jgi:hypothetical protein
MRKKSADMNNEKIIMINGAKVPVASVTHWQYVPQSIVPMRSEEETLRWMAFEKIRRGWDQLDPDSILECLDESFTYGSYWVSQTNLDLSGYRGPDLYYHRIDVTDRANDEAVAREEREEFIATAKMHGAWPMALPVSFFCTDTDGGTAVCGGDFFMKVLESRLLCTDQA